MAIETIAAITKRIARCGERATAIARVAPHPRAAHPNYDFRLHKNFKNV
jgi:hypothetical protein